MGPSNIKAFASVLGGAWREFKTGSVANIKIRYFMLRVAFWEELIQIFA